MAPRELTLQQAASLTRLSASSLRRRCAAGEIPGARLVGKTWVIPGKSVAGIIRRREPKGGWTVARLEDGSRIVERADLEAEFDMPSYELIIPAAVYAAYERLRYGTDSGYVGEIYAGTYESVHDAEIQWRRCYAPEALSQPPVAEG